MLKDILDPPTVTQSRRELLVKYADSDCSVARQRWRSSMRHNFIRHELGTGSCDAQAISCTDGQQLELDLACWCHATVQSCSPHLSFGVTLPHAAKEG